MIRIQKKEDCCGCHACAQICPGKCIEMRPDEEGFLYPRIDAAACVQCGLCEQVCPVLHPQPEPQSKQPAAYAAINRDETVRRESSSGGVFTALAEQVLAGYLTDYSADFLHKATQDTYGDAFGGKAGCTVKVRDSLYALELWHGPTCAFKDYALQKALSGTKFTGFKVVEGRSNRKYTDEAAVAKAVEDAGYEPYEKKLLGITAMSQALGRKKFEELLGGLVYKPPGKPVLVPESDKRPAMNTAINDFKKNEEDNNYGKDRK